MRKVLVAIVMAIGAVGLAAIASPALAECQGGASRNQGPRSVYRLKAPRVGATSVRIAAAPARAAKRLLGKTRFFDGDGQPLRKGR